MDAALNITEVKAFLLALAYTQPRTLGMLIALPLFGPQLVPNMLRMAIAAGSAATRATTRGGPT